MARNSRESKSANGKVRSLVVYAASGCNLRCKHCAVGSDQAHPRRSLTQDDLCEIVYVDHFGNAMTGLRAAMLPPDARLAAAGQVLERERTFSDRPPGAAFWYENSNGLAEIAVNQGRADRELGLVIGIPVEIVS